MTEYRCRNCANYRQHYTFDNRNIFRVYCGHCVVPDVRTRRPDAKICEHFVFATSEEFRFVRKEYLSKELLQYLLNLELLPEIRESEEFTEE